MPFLGWGGGHTHKHCEFSFFLDVAVATCTFSVEPLTRWQLAVDQKECVFKDVASFIRLVDFNCTWSGKQVTGSS